jgi:hypothetical protein
MSWRRKQLMRRYEPLRRPWDGGHLDRTLGILRLSGSWRDIGRAVAEIGGGNAFVAATLAALSRLPSRVQRELSQQAERAFAHVSKSIPHLTHLFDGACEAASISREELILAHCITAISPSTIPRSCGAIGWLTPDGPVIAQTLDLGLTNDTAAALVEPAGGIPFVCHMNIGTMWFSTGINAQGVAIAGASVNVRKDYGAPPPCFVHPFIDLLVLSRASSRIEALALLRGARPFGGPGDGSAHLVADRDGMSVVEIAGDRMEEQRSSRALVNNHFELGGMPALEAADRTAAHYRRLSLSRRQSALRMLDKNTSNDVDTLTAFLEEGHRSDCWNRSAVPPDDGWTTARYVIDVPRRRFTVWNGPRPARPVPVVVDLAQVLGECA